MSRASNDSGFRPRRSCWRSPRAPSSPTSTSPCPGCSALKNLGLRLAVDDFGTGYSSLSYLADLPVSIVKIDKSFIDRITQDSEGAAMVRGVIDLSRALGLTCIAEGVERPSQLAVLDELGCDNTQGYLFAQPTASEDMADTLRRLRAGQTAPLVPAAISG